MELLIIEQQIVKHADILNFNKIATQTKISELLANQATIVEADKKHEIELQIQMEE